MGRVLSAMLIAAVLSACGGSDEESKPSCTPSGTWNVTDTLTMSSGGVCADLGSAPTVINITVDSVERTFTWVEEGQSFAGTINLDSCQGTVVTTLSDTITDGAGNPYVLNVTGSRSAAFNGNAVSGTLNVTASIDPGLPGMPCTATLSTSGTRQ